MTAACLLLACGDDPATTAAPADAGAPDASVNTTPASTAPSASAATSASVNTITLPPSANGGLPSPQSVLTTKDIVDVIPTDLRRQLLGCWKLASGEEWRFVARGKQGLDITQKLAPSAPRYLEQPKPVVVKFSAQERSFAFTSVGGHHPCLIACLVEGETLACSAACSRRPGDDFPVRVGHPVAERCSARP